MGRKKRQRYDVATKGRVALAAWKGDRTVAELASQFAIHPNLVAKWKRQLADNVARVFEGPSDSVGDQAGLVAELYEQIGRLRMELEWLKKKGSSRTSGEEIGRITDRLSTVVLRYLAC